MDERHFRATDQTIKHWAAARLWKVQDAGYLLAGLDPDKARYRLVSSGHNSALDLHHRIATLLEQELGARYFLSEFSPAEIFAAADLLEIDVPEKLRAEVERFEAKRAAAGGRQEAPEATEDKTQADEAGTESEVSPRRANTYRKIIAAIAYDAYGWQPGFRGGTASDIASATERIGSRVSEDTVRSILNEAAEFVDPQAETE